MIYILGAMLVLLAYVPALWVRWVMHHYAKDLEDIPGTGSELAEHLIARFAIDDVVVEETKPQDNHYDNGAKAVRLCPTNFHGRSLTAVAVAAHEVGHAIQFHRREKITELAGRYLPTSRGLQKAGIAILFALPILGLVLRSPGAIAMVIGLSLLLQLAGAFSHLIVLPLEWDASFNKALPILVAGEYVQENQLPAVRTILKAAALTYFAGALADVLNIGRWLLILRR